MKVLVDIDFKKEHHLTLAELFVYSVIDSYTRGKEQCFYGSESKLGKDLGLARYTIIRALQHLVQLGLVIQRGNTHGGRTPVEYVTKSDTCHKMLQDVSQNVTGKCHKMLQVGVTKCDTIYKEDNKEDNKEIKRESEKDLNFSNLPMALTKYLKQWADYLAGIGKGMDQQQLEATAENLRAYSQGNSDKARMIVNKSISNNWKTLQALTPEELQSLNTPTTIGVNAADYLKRKAAL